MADKNLNERMAVVGTELDTGNETQGLGDNINIYSSTSTDMSRGLSSNVNISDDGELRDRTICSFSALCGTACGPDPLINITQGNNDKFEIVPLKTCNRDVYSHLRKLHSGGVTSEVELILARIGLFGRNHSELERMSICPLHRAKLGVGWRPRSTYCCVPLELSGHKSSTMKGENDRSITRNQSMKILEETDMIIPLGSSICKGCRNKLSLQASLEKLTATAEEEKHSTQRLLRSLQFKNPGPLSYSFASFDPETSEREMRKLRRVMHSENPSRQKPKKSTLYDEAGLLIEDGRDLCDCLDDLCPGCHYPCPKCGSEKCGGECRCNRRWIYEQIEVEGSGEIIKFNYNPKMT
ncbi:ARL14 effector protein-like [Saccoglossus kowalevskii]|uniref:ARL14 effector protein-like n=1 Tax=Saccoglossus kowalevskii TaxID=10224 RepID=A0ABM0MUY9_SACKO|nr:PREDICTED: ARL14 effector protein-like [Saccoglossus kowalevskii]